MEPTEKIIKIAENDLKELKRKVGAINELVIGARALEKDKQDFLAGVLKALGCDAMKSYNVDLDSGEVKEAEKKTG